MTKKPIDTCMVANCEGIPIICAKHLESARKEGADTEREKWKKSICATDTIDAPEGGVIGVKAYWVDVKKLSEPARRRIISQGGLINK